MEQVLEFKSMNQDVKKLHNDADTRTFLDKKKKLV